MVILVLELVLQVLGETIGKEHGEVDRDDRAGEAECLAGGTTLR